jgi:hypothetical protein
MNTLNCSKRVESVVSVATVSVATGAATTGAATTGAAVSTTVEVEVFLVTLFLAGAVVLSDVFVILYDVITLIF